MTTSLTNRTTIRDLVAAYQNACAVVRQSFAAIVDAEARLNAVYAMGDHRGFIKLDATRGGHDDDFNNVERCIGHVRRQCWKTVAERLELKRVMSIARARALDEQLEKGELPEITEESIAAFVKHHAGQIGDHFADAVREVFDWLRPHEWTRAAQYKTNTQLELPRRVVLTYMVELGWHSGPGKFRVRYGQAQRLLALDSVFSTLSGRGSVPKTTYGPLCDAINAAPDGTGETEYFRFRACKNGNLHLEMKDAALLRHFNAIAGGKNLRPAQQADESAA